MMLREAKSIYVLNLVPNGGHSIQAKHGNFCRAPKALAALFGESGYYRHDLKARH